MFFSRSFLVTLLSAPLLVLAANPNPFTNSVYNVTAGQPFTLTWTPTTQGTVSLILRSGASSNLAAGTTIASGLSNDGTYTWNVPSSEVRGSDYTIEIVDDSDSSQTNYSPYFVLDSTNTVASSVSLSSVTLGAPTTSLSLSTAPTTAPTASTTASGSSSTGSASSSSGMMTSTSATGASSTQPGLVATATTSSHTGAAARATAMVGMLGAVALGALAL